MTLDFSHLLFGMHLIVYVVRGHVCLWGIVQVDDQVARLLSAEIQRESINIRAMTTKGYCYYFVLV